MLCVRCPGLRDRTEVITHFSYLLITSPGITSLAILVGLWDIPRLEHCKDDLLA